MSDMVHDQKVFSRCLEELKAAAAGEKEGILGPRSLSWEILRETAILLGGGRALILQLAHPAVAEGVDTHSNFRKDPVGRAHRTFSSMYEISFGDLANAFKSARRIHGIHHKVRGEVSPDTPSPSAGGPYRANDPSLLFWVLTTLIDSAHQIFELLVRPLSLAEKKQSYQEARLVALVMGIPSSFGPQDYESYQTYLQEMFSGKTLSFGETGRGLVRELFRATRGADRLLTAALLPEKLRRDLNISFTKEDERRHRWLIAALREGVARSPEMVRFVPAYHQALRRLAEDKWSLPLSTRLIARVGRSVALPLGLAPR